MYDAHSPVEWLHQAYAVSVKINLYLVRPNYNLKSTIRVSTK